MNCQRCTSNRIARISAKCGDLCHTSVEVAEIEGDVPRDMGIGGGDYVRFSYCLECGQIQGTFPIATTEMEEQDDEMDS
jgi:hypothetical protein